jgi:acyl-CoA thioesterase
MEHIKKFFTKDKFAAYSGIELVDVSPGFAKVKMAVKDLHLNGMGMVHGGAIFTLADFAFAVAGNSHGQVAVAINVGITFIKAAPTHGTLYAEARENSINPKLGSYTVRVVDEQDNLIAVFQGLAYRKKDKIE